MPAEPTRDDRTGAGQQSLLEQAARSDRWRSVLLGAFTVGALCGAAALWMLGS